MQNESDDENYDITDEIEEALRSNINASEHDTNESEVALVVPS